MRVLHQGPLDFFRLSPAVKVLVIANFAVFFLLQIAGGPLVALFGLIPRRVLEDFWLWQPATYPFLHANIWHLLFNMIGLWMFGMQLENGWGTREFVKYYFVCALGAALAHLAFTPHSTIPVIGASGAVYGLLVAFAMTYPDAVIYVNFFLPVTARTLAILFGVIEFISVTLPSSSGMATLAHLGGMATGYLYLRWGLGLSDRLKAAYRSLREGSRGPSERMRPRPDEAGLEAEVDRILDKISAQGRDSLTEEEKEVLRRYSQKTGHA